MSLEMTGGHGWVSRDLPRGELIPNPPDPTSLKDAAPWWKIIPEMKAESHPPLYYVLLRGWRETFGSSETAVRMLSTLFSLLAIYLLYDFTKLVAGRFGRIVGGGHLHARGAANYLFAGCAQLHAAADDDGLDGRAGIENRAGWIESPAGNPLRDQCSGDGVHALFCDRPAAGDRGVCVAAISQENAHPHDRRNGGDRGIALRGHLGIDTDSTSSRRSA